MAKNILTFLSVYEEETHLLLWAFVILFVIRSSGVILNNYAETTFLKRYGVQYLPIVNMLNAGATFVVTGILTAFMSRSSSATLLFYTFMFSGTSVMLIRILIPFGIDLLYPILFMLKSQYELLQALLFWNICNDVFNTRQSKRLFPLLTAGGVIGLILGSFGTPYFARLFDLDNLLYLYLGTCVSGAFLIRIMVHNYTQLLVPPQRISSGRYEKPAMLKEIRKIIPLIRHSLLVKLVLVLTFMPNVLIPIMNYQFNYAADNRFASEAALLQFFGYFRGGQYLISLVILLFVGRIYGRWGLPVALMFHPFNYILAFFALLFRFDLFAAVYARVSTTIIRTTINMPAHSILIGLFPESYRNLVRPFLRGTIVRMALFLGSGLILISVPLFHPRYLSLVALPFLLAWIAAPFLLKSRYSEILTALISKNLPEIKSADQDQMVRAFNDPQTIQGLARSFAAARGEEAVWYASLLQKIDPGRTDRLILQNLENQDSATRIALIKIISPEPNPDIERRLANLLSTADHEVTIAILKRMCRHGFEGITNVDMSSYLHSDHAVVRGFAVGCLCSGAVLQHRGLIDDWLTAKDSAQRQSGIVAAGLCHEQSYIPRLLAILGEDRTDPLIPDIIIALARLGAPQLNSVVFTFLTDPQEKIRLAALDQLTITDAVTLRKTLTLLGDASSRVRAAAQAKISAAGYQNHLLLIEALRTPSKRVRAALFELLEALDIRDFDVLRYAQENLNTCYVYLAMAHTLEAIPSGPMRALAADHLRARKEKTLENVLRVLAIHDRTGRMQATWRGLFSRDMRQRANAIELLNNLLGRNLFARIRPLLESPTTTLALAEGRKTARLPEFTSHAKGVVAALLASADWVDVIAGLGLVRQEPDLLEDADTLTRLSQADNPYIVEETRMTQDRIQSRFQAAPAHTIDSAKTPDSAEMPLAEKILLLKHIDIFSGLSAEELAAIAAVSTEMAYAREQIVIRQDDPGDTVFLIIEGKVAVIMEQPDQSEEILDTMEAGNAFGEMALIDDAPRSATIRTVSPCRFLVLHKQEFKETALEFPEITLQICATLSRRIRHLHARIQNSRGKS